MNKTGAFAGSFDPITNGHVWVIERSLDVVDRLYVVVGINPAKKHLLTADERVAHVTEVLSDSLGDRMDRVTVVTVSKQLLINYVAQVGASFLIRGVRSSTDFEYERQVQLINRKIQPTIETLFFVPPPSLTEVSSSTVKSLVGFEGWEDVVSSYIHPKTVELLKVKRGS